MLRWALGPEYAVEGFQCKLSSLWATLPRKISERPVMSRVMRPGTSISGLVVRRRVPILSLGELICAPPEGSWFKAPVVSELAVDSLLD